MNRLIHSMVPRERRRLSPSSSLALAVPRAITACAASKDEADRYPDDLTRDLLEDLQSWSSSSSRVVGGRGSKGKRGEDESAIAFVEEVLSSSRAAGEEETADVLADPSEVSEDEEDFELETLTAVGGRYDSELLALRREEDLILAAPLQEELRLVLEELGAEEPWRVIASENLGLKSFGRDWRKVIATLSKGLRIPGNKISEMITRFSGLLALSSRQIEEVREFLADRLELSPKEVRYVVSRRPSLLSLEVWGERGMEATAEELLKLGLKKKHLQVVLMTFPGILTVKPKTIMSVVDVLCDEESGGLDVEKDFLPLVRKAPWVLLFDPAREIEPVLECLFSLELDLRKVISAYPMVLGLKVDEQILESIAILQEFGFENYEIAYMIESHPAILGTEIVGGTFKMLEFFQQELLIEQQSLLKMVRAFPSLLHLDMQRHVVPCVEFLREIGISNIGRIFALIPPILWMDVETVLRPKLDFMLKVGLTAFDIARFPQVFAYPLDRILRPRLLFLRFLEIPITSKPLEWIIAPTDENFCEVTLSGVSLDSYQRFLDQIPPMPQLPEPRKRKVSTAGGALVRPLTLSNVNLQLKGDCHFPGFHARLKELMA